MENPGPKTAGQRRASQSKRRNGLTRWSYLPANLRFHLQRSAAPRWTVRPARSRSVPSLLPTKSLIAPPCALVLKKGPSSWVCFLQAQGKTRDTGKTLHGWWTVTLWWLTHSQQVVVNSVQICFFECSAVKVKVVTPCGLVTLLVLFIGCVAWF